MSQDWIALIQRVVAAPGLDWRLVTAIVRTESGGNPHAMRYEPNYVYLERPDDFAKQLGTTLLTETMLQCFSFGLMQVMGGTARSLGFKDELVKLCDPELGLQWGCLLLARLTNKYQNTPDILAAYNGGSPRKSGGKLEPKLQEYVDKVLANYALLKQ